MEGRKDVATCPSCGLQVDRRASGSTCLRLRWSGPPPRSCEVAAATLADRIAASGGALSRATTPDGSLSYEAEVRVRTAGTELPIRYRGRLLGFAERFGGGTPGVLHLSDDALTLHPAPPGATPADALSQGTPGPTPQRRWALDDIRSLQTSSSSVQITTATDGVVLFRFVRDSPRRWDELLRHAISRRWRGMGKGRVQEFQPRIRAEGPPP
jgi:hypothetical protein